MDWAAYGAFLIFAAVLVLVPGPDFAVVTKNTLSGGQRRGVWASVGVTSSTVVQGAAAAAGLGVLIVRVEPLFQAVKWAGICYLLVLGVQALLSAIHGDYTRTDADAVRGQPFRGWRQGFLCNITNPKVLVFYLAVLPQFLGPHAPLIALLLFALGHAVLTQLYLLLVVAGIGRIRHIVTRRPVRRALDAGTGCVLIGFGAALALENA